MKVKINDKYFQAKELWIKADTEKTGKILNLEPKDFEDVKDYILQNEVINIYFEDISYGSYSQNEIIFGEKQILFVMKEDLK